MALVDGLNIGKLRIWARIDPLILPGPSNKGTSIELLNDEACAYLEPFLEKDEAAEGVQKDVERWVLSSKRMNEALPLQVQVPC